MIEMFSTHFAEIMTVLINLFFVIAAYYKLFNRVEISEKTLKDIEEKRLANVSALREIYDSKVEDAKKYAKGLFEIREGELKEISKQLSELKLRVDHQTEILNNALANLSVGMAEIRTHIKSCPYYHKRIDLDNEK